MVFDGFIGKLSGEARIQWLELQQVLMQEW